MGYSLQPYFCRIVRVASLRERERERASQALQCIGVSLSEKQKDPPPSEFTLPSNITNGWYMVFFSPSPVGGLTCCYTNLTVHCQPDKILVVACWNLGHGDRKVDLSEPMPNAAGH